MVGCFPFTLEFIVLAGHRAPIFDLVRESFFCLARGLPHGDER